MIIADGAELLFLRTLVCIGYGGLAYHKCNYSLDYNRLLYQCESANNISDTIKEAKYTAIGVQSDSIASVIV